MSRWYSHCEMCKRSIFEGVEFEAFRLSRHELERIDLEGREPYQGVRCLCLHCIHIVALAAKRH